ncbi:gem-associated protein 4 isoform X2 [Ambystoma mexicanum]|uniref:gem-associated protein 4 isoform X2 n=1 Tax=Ambystoma mexicanum TaxID=8296 RepID=UPI0037E96BA6
MSTEYVTFFSSCLLYDQVSLPREWWVRKRVHGTRRTTDEFHVQDRWSNWGVAHPQHPLGPWDICEETTVLQGGFLLAEKLYHPKPLKHLSKSDWAVVGDPIARAVDEICTTRSSGSKQTREWKKVALAIVWAKVLSCRSEAALPPISRDIDKKWKEDLFFAVGNMIPDINHTLLFELLKTLKNSGEFVQLLLALPVDICSKEVILFVEHVLQESTMEDIMIFLDVWWEIMKHADVQEDNLVAAFKTVACLNVFDSSDGFTQPPKRFKSDSEAPQSPTSSVCILALFLEGLKRMKADIVPLNLRHYALANLADTLSAYAFQDVGPTMLSIEQYLGKMAKVISVWTSDPECPHYHSSLFEKVQEAERYVRAVGPTPKCALLPEMKRLGLGVLQDLLLRWESKLPCVVPAGSRNDHESFRTADSLTSLLEKLKGSSGCASTSEGGTVSEMTELQHSITHFLENFAIDKNVDVHIQSGVAMNIIARKMYRHKEVCSVFASPSAWALSSEWVNCLKENVVLFREPDLVFALLKTVMASVDSSHDQIQRVNAAMESILICFSELFLPDKNKVLLGVLSTWGRKGLSQKLKTFMAGFQEELNMAFNQITQSASDSGLAKAASAVARLAVLHPEATLRKICHIAIGNLGAHTFLAQIIQSLPAFSFRDAQNSKASLLVDCLKETSWGNFSSDKEERQFFTFLTSLVKPLNAQDPSSVPLLSPEEVTQALVLPYLTSDFTNVALSLQILNAALSVESPEHNTGRHWVMSCSPFPLIMSLCKLLDEYTKYWQHSGEPQCLPLESKDLIIDALQRLCKLVQQEAWDCSETWNKSLFWLHRKMEHLDWTVGLRLKPLFGDHFKNEVPASLFEVCTLSENDWTPLHLPEYGPGTGLLAWMECCSISAEMKDQMLSLLAVNTKKPEDVNYFSKGFLVALVQVFPWCNPREWDLLSQVVKSLLQRQLLHIPYTLEYVQFMPLLNLRPFAHDLQFSVLLLRGFQFLCSSSCSDWLPVEGWKHVARLYCSSIAGTLDSVKAVLASYDLQKGAKDHDLFQEALFVYTQVFCHVLHIVAMMPADTCEPLYFMSLEILCLYEVAGVADISTNSLLRRANERHFLHSITENVTNEEQRITLLQKISKLK